MPQLLTTIGNVHASKSHGIVELQPRTEELRKLVEAEKISRFLVVADFTEPTEPLAVCRMLLKIGLEQLGKHFYEVSISERVRAAREFARRPRRGENWWFILRSNPEQYVRRASQHCDFSIEIIEREGILFSIMHMLGVSTMIPLEQGAMLPDAGVLSEPEYRTVVATC